MKDPRVGMNRRERRALDRATGVRDRVDADHTCDKNALNRFKRLDHTVKSIDCLECGGAAEVSPEDCPNCDDGVVPTTDYMGFKCPVCSRAWIRLSYRQRGTLYTSWRAADELLADG